MHPEARHFTEFVKKNYFKFFTSSSEILNVLDVGSGDVNGNNKFLFEKLNVKYEGNDMVQGKNVTIVSPTSKLNFDENFFDIIVSTECFEHDPEYEKSLKNIARMCKNIFFFTCASTGRKEHGTRRTNINESFASKGKIEIWQDYYKNLTKNDVLFLTECFPYYRMYYNNKSKDLYFVGLKNNNVDVSLYPEYEAKNVSKL
jgi:hypothetical protein